MNGPVRCFLVTHTPRAWVRLRRWSDSAARPSILTPGYHGWLTDGVLTPC